MPRSHKTETSWRSPEPLEETPQVQLAVCTRSEDCKADVDGHEPDCPVEAELKATFGF